ncbi:Fumarylacetoacetate (FAA) hydrolase family protein [Polystyrenella longa]|uniref:Fumarylacetoacetate (FAA) hydrolase family protein n=1 Tax=Polystyrenella longa TaxID=2528007 RepID=A0A518CJ12_9PLAN|nr:fumarylacetoacetate hydrolase family protein [Polystyrenella longa]QDU79211.1 Fumarylacetoacetate (FAA) hydrolase family protein [Polystyrenella longa]
MKLAKVVAAGEVTPAVVEGDEVRLLDLTQVENVKTLSDILHSPDPVGLTRFLIDTKLDPVSVEQVEWLPPLDQQEVWAAGVTYKRSQQARMEESETGASHYDKVYEADRPELFFKATPNRVVAPGKPVRVRYDSNWSVPEPEFALVINPDMKIVGYTIGNDMSARDIEGENPLYLPQAKLYKECCALGPSILLAGDGELNLAEIEVRLKIERNGETIVSGETALDQLHRSLTELVAWLGRDNEFPGGAILLTGTGIIPPDEFSLEQDDLIHMSVTGIGTLTNPVVKD